MRPKKKPVNPPQRKLNPEPIDEGGRVHLVVGLGNPGKVYRKTRHNTGFEVLDALADQFSIPIHQRAKEVVFGTGIIEGYDVILAKPQGYMNRSGQSVRRLCNDFKIWSEAVLVIHDDIDITLGNIKIKEKGGHGGHKGVRSLMDALESDRFIRIRVGIGRPESATSVTDYVLGDFGPDENAILEKVVQKAKEAVLCILCHGTKEGMNRFNNNKTKISR